MVERLEKETRKNNIVMNGLKINTEATKILNSGMENFIEQHLNVTVQIKQVHKLGEKICLIKLKQEKEKNMEYKNKLKKLKDLHIFINNSNETRKRNTETHDV